MWLLVRKLVKFNRALNIYYVPCTVINENVGQETVEGLFGRCFTGPAQLVIFTASDKNDKRMSLARARQAVWVLFYVSLIICRPLAGYAKNSAEHPRLVGHTMNSRQTWSSCLILI